MKVTTKVKKYWNDHKGQIAVVSTVVAVGAIMLQQRNLRVFNDFLKEKNLFDEYWMLEE